ncbi:hypothetical protein LPJ66_000485 [Kickxella alabastrina]|uniref:Uncharacterized protein n=1 Tax=Kickxella alabastrina TaxID=61397 RepID=A0ACC1IVY0_9FUNG|nr:hypothetical protein LPJ66_000485 [Kickxella alabastrina]
MKVLAYLSLLLTGTSMLAANAMAAGQSKYNKRLETSRAAEIKGAILLKNAKATTCELALVSNLVGFVSANCLDFTGNTTDLDASTKYQVLISDGKTTSLGTFDVDSITVHPSYDPVSFANNLALLKFNTGSPIEFKNYIAANRAEWTSNMYVRRGVTANTVNGLMEPQAVIASSDATSKCALVSTLYGGNLNDLMCTEQVLVANEGNKTCLSPYGAVYGVRDPDLAIAGLYSHSVLVGGDNLCEATSVCNFYTVLSNFLEWGGDVAESTIYLYVADNNYINNFRPSYEMMVPPGKPTIEGVVIGGNLNGLTVIGTVAKASESASSAAETLSSSSPIGPSSTPSSSTPSSSAKPSSEPSSSEPSSSADKKETASASVAATTASTPNSTANTASLEQQDTGKKTNMTTILIIAGVGILVIAIICFIIYKRWKNKRRPKQTYRTELNNDDFDAGYQEDNGGHIDHLNTGISQGRSRRPVDSYDERYAGTYEKGKNEHFTDYKMNSGKDRREYD